MIKYTKDHEWLRIEGPVGIVGITDHAKTQLGNLVYVELPDIGSKIKQGKEVAVVESVKAASEIYAPISGEVIETNTALLDNPSLVDESPEDKGWFFKIRIENPQEVETLMSPEHYKAYVNE